MSVFVEIVVHTFLAPPCGLQRWRPSNIKLVNIVNRVEYCDSKVLIRN